MTRPYPLCLMLAAISAAGVCGQTPAEAEQMLKGTWVVHWAERDGEETTKLKDAKYHFSDGKLTMTPGGPEKLPPRFAKYKVSLDEKVDRYKLEFIPEEGDNKGKVMDGIFRIKDGGLELCHCGKARDEKPVLPADFVTSKGSGLVYMKLKKE